MTGILPGEHALTLALDTYQDYTTRVVVTAGETTQVNAVLSPSAAAEGQVSYPSVLNLPERTFSSTTPAGALPP